MSPTTRPASFPADHPTVTTLFLAYAASLPIRLDFQGFEHELAGLPGKFAQEKRGALFLAYAPSASDPDSDANSGAANGHVTNERASVNAEADADANADPSKCIGCVAIRPFAPPDVCELKRLYVVPSARGTGAAHTLMEVVLQRARELGYREVLLDTLASMTAARRLYEGFGFVETGKYYESVEGAVFYRLVL
jgi:ribosomal protein S18 acetylase RimI-like enzyme